MSPDTQVSQRSRPELLAPAGGPAALTAALDAGADAVYFGLQQLNARRGAENFTPEALAATVQQVHAAGARAYLTLNIDITQRELGNAARHLELARQAGVDAVLVRDPALLALLPLYPELEFHFSTQAGICNSAGMRAAAALGIRRVVLARELTLDEVDAACRACAVEGEVFIQGALCFGVSGRCLLSSWVGGRSGNRGACASPCRVPWQVAGQPAGRALSMHDLSLLERLPALAAAGVRALKIEGRLKKPQWVADAVRLYRDALAGTPPAVLRDANLRLGDYTGRQLTSGYLDGQRTDLTGEAARPAGTGAAAEPAAAETESAADSPRLNENEYTVAVIIDGNTLSWQAACRDTAATWRTPLSHVSRPERALTLQTAGQRLGEAPLQGFRLARFTAAEPERLVPRNTVNHVEKELSAFLHRVRKAPDGMVRVELPAAVRERLQAPEAAAPANTRCLGAPPDRIRIEASRAAALLAVIADTRVTLIVEQATPADLAPLAAGAGQAPAVIALPPVFYEADIPGITDLLAACRNRGIAVEVNSWDGWHLARQAGVTMDAGPGLMVLNRLAARFLAEQGCRAVTVSLEADQEQVRDLCHDCPVPLSLCVYGRPALLMTRAELPAEWVAAGAEFADARQVRLRPRREGALTMFRPVEPYSLMGLRDDAVRIAHVVADLVAAPDPAAEWQTLGQAGPAPCRFNFTRSLR